MLDRPARPRLEIVADLVGEILAKYSVAGPLAADAELARLGLTSIDMVELMLAVEAEFDIMIPPAEITNANFRSVRSMEALVGRLAPSASEEAAQNGAT